MVQLHCIIGCDANSGFYGKGKSLVYDKGSKEPTRYGDSLDFLEEILENLFKFTRHVIYGDTKSTTMAEARTAKWNDENIRLPLDADCLHQHCLCAKYLAFLIRHPSLLRHLDMVGIWLVATVVLSATHDQLSLWTNLHPVPAGVNKKDEIEEVGYDSINTREYSSVSDDSGTNCSDLD